MRNPQVAHWPPESVEGESVEEAGAMAEQRVEDGSAAPAPGAVRRSVVLPAPLEVVWALVTEADHLSAWLGGEVEVDPCPGGQIVVREDGRLRRGVIVDVEPL